MSFEASTSGGGFVGSYGRLSPDVTSTRPSASVVAVGYQRAWAMSGVFVQVFEVGLKMLEFLIPSSPGPPVQPPTTSVRPSARLTWPPQNLFPVVALGTGTNVLFVGFQRRSEPGELPQRSHVSTFPVGVNVVSTPTTGQFRTGPQSPSFDGPGPAGTTSMPAISGSSAEP